MTLGTRVVTYGSYGICDLRSATRDAHAIVGWSSCYHWLVAADVCGVSSMHESTTVGSPGGIDNATLRDKVVQP
jgi:hypothetical protein